MGPLDQGCKKATLLFSCFEPTLSARRSTSTASFSSAPTAALSLRLSCYTLSAAYDCCGQCATRAESQAKRNLVGIGETATTGQLIDQCFCTKLWLRNGARHWLLAAMASSDVACRMNELAVLTGLLQVLALQMWAIGAPSPARTPVEAVEGRWVLFSSVSIRLPR